VDTYSVLQLLRDLILNTAPTYYQIAGGNDRLPRALAEQLSAYITYQAPVTRIAQSTDAVQVSFLENNATPQTISADRVVCSVPLTVLDRIDMQPALSPEKQRAIDELAYTSVSRVMVQTKTRFWQDQGKSGYTATDLPIALAGDTTFSQSGQRGILESLTAGNKARQIGTLSHDDRLKFVLPHMEAVFPGVANHMETSASISWDADEWAKGGYVWFQPGQMGQHLPTIAQPQGRIHFAGEHTSPWNGWMQGALESGERAAQEILTTGLKVSRLPDLKTSSKTAIQCLRHR
ncbi:MAG: FAD-dependent oxidoreductase, partial [Cyanobacteria bacterium P01_D01_bin.56]